MQLRYINSEIRGKKPQKIAKLIPIPLEKS